MLSSDLMVGLWLEYYVSILVIRSNCGRRRSRRDSSGGLSGIPTTMPNSGPAIVPEKRSKMGPCGYTIYVVSEPSEQIVAFPPPSGLPQTSRLDYPTPLRYDPSFSRGQNVEKGVLQKSSSMSNTESVNHLLRLRSVGISS